MSRADRITTEVRKYDSKLYAKKEDGVIHIYRKCKELRKEWLADGVPVLNVVENPYRVMSLTDTGNIRGKSVDWGIDPILAKLRAMDLWNSGIGVEHFKEEHEKAEKSKERDFANSTEAFLYDMKSAFAKSVSDVNTSNLTKIDKRREGDKRIWR